MHRIEPGLIPEAGGGGGDVSHVPGQAHFVVSVKSWGRNICMFVIIMEHNITIIYTVVFTL